MRKVLPILFDQRKEGRNVSRGKGTYFSVWRGGVLILLFQGKGSA